MPHSSGSNRASTERPRTSLHRLDVPRLISSGAIRAVTFDVGGTLIKPWPSVGHVYASVAATHGWPGIPPETLNRNFSAAWRALKRFRHSRAEWEGLVLSTFDGYLAGRSIRTIFPDLYRHFAEPVAWHLFDDVVPTLKRLRRRGIKLGIISNWDRRLSALLRQMRLHDYFDEVVVSCYAGVCKPSRAIFEKAARRLGVPPRGIVHVGDRPDADVRGAHVAGMHAVLLQRGRATSRPGTISSLKQLCG